MSEVAEKGPRPPAEEAEADGSGNLTSAVWGESAAGFIPRKS